MIWDLKRSSDNTAVISEDGTTLTYAQLAEKTDSFASAAGGRCLVMIFCRNETGALTGYVGALNNGIVPIMVSAELESGLLEHLIRLYKPKYLWLPHSMKNEFRMFVSVYSDSGYSLLKTGYDNEFELYDELALLLTTSGSTGSSKMVRQSYKNIISNTASITEYLALDENERPITTLPMNYTYGLSILNTHLYVGAAVILTGKTVMQREFWQQFKEHQATSFGGVPYIYEMLAKLRFFRMELPSLRTMTQAGGKLSPELHKQFAEYAAKSGKHFVVMYGQTEATARMAYLPHDKALEKYGSMGIPIPGGRFELIGADGEVITEPEITGELVYYGENTALGYAESGADLIKGDEWHGRNVTGDMAKRDADGYYYITGRKKRFLKIFGSRVNLDETERLTKTQFPELDLCCGGVDDKLYVFITDTGKKDAVKKFLSEKLRLNPSAFEIVKMDKVPRNDSGKILYRELEKYYV